MGKKTKIACILIALALVVAGLYFGPQLFRRSADYISRPDAPPLSAHWTTQTSYFVQSEIDIQTGNLVGWHHPESTSSDTVTLVIDPDEPFAFTWNWSRHPTVDIGFDLREDRTAEFWIGDRAVRNADGFWVSDPAGFGVETVLSQAEVAAFAVFLNERGFGDMPKEYELTGMADGWWWTMIAKQNGTTKYVKFNNMFPKDGREIAAYIMREIAAPRASEFDAAERSMVEARPQDQNGEQPDD